jgi:transposase-like protein
VLEVRPTYAAGLRRWRARLSDKWYLDEVQLKINGKRHWRWRAVDKHGVILDILVQQRRDQHAAETFLRRVLAGSGHRHPQPAMSGPLVALPPEIAFNLTVPFDATDRL